MTTFPLVGQDGQTYPVEADSLENAQKALAWEQQNKIAPATGMTTFPLYGQDRRTYPVQADTLQNAQKALAWEQNQQPGGGVTKPVSPDPSLIGQALSAVRDTLKGPALTTTVRGLGNAYDAAWDPYGTLMAPIRTMISPEEEHRYQTTEAEPGPGKKLGDAFFHYTGIPEYQPTSAPERTLMAIGEGAAAGTIGGRAGSFIGALGSGLGQTARELFPGYERVATAAELAPALLSGGRTASSGPEIPTAKDLKAASNAGYDTARASPVTIDRAPLMLHNLAGDAIREVSPKYDVTMMPESMRVINNKIMEGDNLNFNDIQNLRDSLNTIIKGNLKSGNQHEVALASELLGRIDKHVDSLPSNPQYVTSGTPDEVADVVKTYQDAGADWGAAQRANKIGGGLRGGGPNIMERAEQRTQAQNSGRNYDNVLRGQVDRFMQKDRNLTGFSDEELAALDSVRAGSRARDFLRSTSNMLGGGPSLTSLASSGIGGTAGTAAGFGPFGKMVSYLAPPFVGGVARSLENNLARRAISSVDEQVRMRSPEYERRLANMPPQDVAATRSFLPGFLAPPPQPGTPAGTPMNSEGVSEGLLDYWKRLHGY